MPDDDRSRKLELLLRWALFLAYAAVTFVLTLRHEPWALVTSRRTTDA